MAFLLKIFQLLPVQEYKYCSLLFVLMLFGAMLEAIGIGAIFPLISAMGNEKFLLEHETLSGIVAQIGIYNHTAFILFCATGLIVFYLLKNLFLSFELRAQICFAVRNQVFFSRQLLAEYLAKPYIFHLRHNTTTLLYNVNEGAMIVFTLVVLQILGLMTECITSFAIWIMLLMVDAFTSVIIAVFFGGLIVIVLLLFRERIRRQGELQNDYHIRYLTWVNQSLGAIKETKTMHTEPFFLINFDAAYKAYGKARGTYDFLNQLPKMLIEVAVVSGLLLLIILKISMGTAPMDMVSLMGLLAFAAFRLMPSVNRIVAYYNTIKYQTPFFYGIYPELKEIKKRSGYKAFDSMIIESKRASFDFEIYIDHLSFSYDDKQEILRDVTFRIRKGDYIGIIGESGAGKTTFVDILLGLLVPSKGRILVDGMDIFSDIRKWQDNLAYVPQEIYLIDASIRENIVFGQETGKIDNIWLERVLHMAELYDYVQSLPDGLETVVGERGVRMSGGQRQRIGIARALYRKPQVLILDEATSALDNETEKGVVNTILKLKGKMTIISIAHRVSTLEECDYKVYFHDGVCEIVW